jgi:hypothetical protein
MKREAQGLYKNRSSECLEEVNIDNQSEIVIIYVEIEL